MNQNAKLADLILALQEAEAPAEMLVKLRTKPCDIGDLISDLWGLNQPNASKLAKRLSNGEFDEIEGIEWEAVS